MLAGCGNTKEESKKTCISEPYDRTSVTSIFYGKDDEMIKKKEVRTNDICGCTR